MRLPPGFVPGLVRDENRFFQEYHLESDPSIQIYFEYRGRRMSEAASNIFRDLILAAPRNVTLIEIEQYRELLQTKSDPTRFRPLIAKTQDIKGKRVLVVEGIFLKFNLQARTLYVDSDGTGSAVQEISFQTPVDRFIKYVLPGTRCLESILWK